MDMHITLQITLIGETIGNSADFCAKQQLNSSSQINMAT